MSSIKMKPEKELVYLRQQVVMLVEACFAAEQRASAAEIDTDPDQIIAMAGSHWVSEEVKRIISDLQDRLTAAEAALAAMTKERDDYEAAVAKMRENFHAFQCSPYRGEFDQWAYRYGDVFRFLASLPPSKQFPMLVRPGDAGLKPWISETEGAK